MKKKKCQDLEDSKHWLGMYKMYTNNIGKEDYVHTLIK